MAKKAAIITLGCRLNHADTALLTRRLERAGFEVVSSDFKEEIDLILLNSCAVTAEAVRKSRQMLRQYRKKYPDSLIAVSGCAATGLHRFKELAARNIGVRSEPNKVIQAVFYRRSALIELNWHRGE